MQFSKIQKVEPNCFFFFLFIGSNKITHHIWTCFLLYFYLTATITRVTSRPTWLKYSRKVWSIIFCISLHPSIGVCNTWGKWFKWKRCDIFKNSTFSDVTNVDPQRWSAADFFDMWNIEHWPAMFCMHKHIHASKIQHHLEAKRPHSLVHNMCRLQSTYNTTSCLRFILFKITRVYVPLKFPHKYYCNLWFFRQ